MMPETETTSSLMGPKILLEGPAGTGKTYALGTLADWAEANGKEMFVLFTENGLESLLGYWTDRGLPIPKSLHWHSTLTKPIGLEGLVKAANNVGRLSYEALTKSSDPNRGDNNAFEKILQACSNFPDDRTGKKFGAIDWWGNDGTQYLDEAGTVDPARLKEHKVWKTVTADYGLTPENAYGKNYIFAIDSLSELANAAVKMVIGNKPTMSMPEYGLAQMNLISFLRLCTQGIPCTFAITAHVTRETDEITGGVKLMTKSIGKALAGEIPQLFSDVIYTVREGSSFYWDTAAANVDVKSRSLPIKAKQPPDFGQIMSKWVSRGGK